MSNTSTTLVITEVYQDLSSTAGTTGGVVDPISAGSGNYYTCNKGSIAPANSPGIGGVGGGSFSFGLVPIAGPIYALVATKTVFTNQENEFSPESWEEYVEDLAKDFGEEYTNSAFITTDPVEATVQPPPEQQEQIEEVVNDPAPRKPNRYKIKSVYNFPSDNFEALTCDSMFNPLTIPSVFSAISSADTEEEMEERNTNLRYSSLIPESLSNSLKEATQTNKNVEDYFTKLAEIYNYQDSRSVLSYLKNVNETIEVSEMEMETLKKINYVPFPFYNEISLCNIENDNTFINFLRDLPDAKQELLEFLSDEDNSKEISYIQDGRILSENMIKTYDLKKWIERGLQQQEYTSGYDTTILNGPYRTSKQLEYLNIAKFIRDNFKNKARSYQQLTKPAINKEVLFYKIEKRQFSHDSSAIVQTFWITPDEDGCIKLIDTQIRFCEQYYYTIKSYIVNVDTSYLYENYYSNELERLEDIKNGIYKILISTKPKYSIHEVEVARVIGAIAEDPPTKPVVNIVKSDKKIAIEFLQSSQKEIEDYKIIEDTDFNAFEAVRAAQRTNNLSKITFTKNDSYSKDIEIYKTTIMPTSLMSFQGKKYKKIKLNNTNTIYDTLVPGIKYYYLFRYMNRHGCPSNPSKVYELEMKDEDGYVYLIKKEIDLDRTTDILKHKDLKRYLLIRPSIAQLQPRFPEEITYITDVNLGPVGPSVWGDGTNKKFKLRITSKKTNRVIEFDLNARINWKNN